jgi:hypothetical protein
LNITFERHGEFPDVASFTPHTGVRIAFMEPTRAGLLKPRLEAEGRLLIITATDIQQGQIGVVASWLCQQKAWVSDRVKHLLLRRSINFGEIPNCPMSLTDAKAILDFVSAHQGQHQQCVVSCAYGKSRSGTTAGFLRHWLNPSVAIPQPVPNPYILKLLQVEARARMTADEC